MRIHKILSIKYNNYSGIHFIDLIYNFEIILFLAVQFIRKNAARIRSIFAFIKIHCVASCIHKHGLISVYP